MRSFLFGLVAICAVALFSCERVDTPVEESYLKIMSSKTINVCRQGGTYSIKYRIDPPIEGEEVRVSSDNEEMIASMVVASEGNVVVEVAPNPTHDERQANVTISYGNLSESVLFVQEGMEHIEVAANQLIGNYYGERLQPGLGHYWIIMSKDGIVDGELANGSEFFRLDLIAAVAEDEENIRIPDGRYTYDATNSFTEFTMPNLGNTDYTYVDDGGMAWAEPFVEATLDVKGSKFTLEAATEERTFSVTFDGDYSITANIISDHISTLEEDLEIDLAGCKGTLSNYGDYWMCGYTNWGIEFVHTRGLKYGTYLVLDFISESTTSCVGTYRYSGFSGEDETKPNFAPGFYVPGMRISDDGVHMMGSLVQINKDGKGIDQAPLYGGEFTISQNDDGSYHIVIDALDDAEPAHRITLDWSGNLQL